MTLSSGNRPGIGSGICLGCGSGIRHGIGIPLATVLGDVLRRCRVIYISRIVGQRHTAIAGFDCFQPECSFRALCCLLLQNMVKEVLNDTFVHVAWVPQFEPSREIFRTDE
jgi:hypothetical protein